MGASSTITADELYELLQLTEIQHFNDVDEDNRYLLALSCDWLELVNSLVKV